MYISKNNEINYLYNNENKLYQKIKINPNLIADMIFHLLVGLNNKEFIYYMNSALQLIFRCYEFITELLSLDINSENKITNSLKDLLYDIYLNMIYIMNLKSIIY